MADITTKDVLTLEELKNLTGQAAKAAVIYDTSTGEPNGLDVEIFINMDTSIGVVDASVQALEQQASDLSQVKADKATQIIAGAGTTGGGNLSESRTINVVSADDGITVNADNIKLNIVNDLVTTSATRPLSAAQGKKLQDEKESLSNKSTDIVADAASTKKYPSVKLIKDYADSLVVGLLDYRGGFDASVNAYPSTGGSGTGGAILKGDMWVVSVAGTIDGKAIHAGDSLIANVDSPAQDSAKWNTVQSNLSYVPEDVANKKTEISESDQHYPTNGAVHRHVAAEKVSIIESLTGQIDGGVSSSVYGGCGVVDGGSPSTIF
jgi:hypothetical protein